MAASPNLYPTINITKLDAACRQLRTAITLWFHDGDPIAIHTLACAAYEIIHVVSKKRGRTRDLIFDSLVVKDEYRSEFNISIKKYASFFKHASRDADDTIEFAPQLTEQFIVFSILGLEFIGEPKETEESIFVYWWMLHKPELLTKLGKKHVSERLAVNQLEELRTLSKKQFFEIMQKVRRNTGK